MNLNFASDNTGPVAPAIMDAILAANTGAAMPYGNDPWMPGVRDALRTLFDWPEAEVLLVATGTGANALALAVAIPEFGPLFQSMKDAKSEVVQGEVKVSRQGRLENLLVRMATRRGDDGGLEGYVVAFDDVTDLVSAQRMAAWGDVARRIAHEIKNPLTPIQLSAERIRRKFAPMVGDDSDKLTSMTDMIVRQTGDLRRIVDEFSKFARMPEPERAETDLVALLRDAVTLQSQQLGPALSWDLPETSVPAEVDRTMISQALTNLIKNAGEAIESLQDQGAPEGFAPQVRVTLDLAAYEQDISRVVQPRAFPTAIRSEISARPIPAPMAGSSPTPMAASPRWSSTRMQHLNNVS